MVRAAVESALPVKKADKISAKKVTLACTV